MKKALSLLLALLIASAAFPFALAEYTDAETVKAVQQALKDRGYYRGEVDGVMSRATESAIGYYQERREMKQTGKIDDELLSALKLSPPAPDAPAQDAASEVGSEPEAEAAPASSIIDLPDANTPAKANGFIYNVLDDGSAEITAYTGSASRVEIPAKLDGHPVSSVGECAFQGNTALQAVVFPDSVTNIGNGAFNNCIALADVSLPKKLASIGSNVFWRCDRLKSIGPLPDTLTKIGQNPFAGCTALETLRLANQHPALELIDGVLFSRQDRRLIWYPIPGRAQAYTVPEGTKAIDAMAFCFCPVTKVSIPESVEWIGGSAFSYCSQLREINIPSKVERLDSVTPGCASLENIYVSPGNTRFETIDGVLFTRGDKALLQYPAGRAQTSYTVPEGTTAISTCAFENTHLTSIELPGSLRSIQFSAFGSSAITRITIPEGVESIAGYAFQVCSDLEEVSLPRSLQYLEASAFSGASNLRRIILADDHPLLCMEEDCLFMRESGTLIWYSPFAERTLLTLPEGVRVVGSSSIRNEYLEELILPEGVTEIRLNAFDSCKRLRRVSLPASLTVIAEHTLQSTVDVHEKKERVVYTVPAGSYAEEFCRLYELSYETAK